MIREFKGEYAWLSNFEPVEIVFEGRTYSSVEHAYMSAKSEDEAWKDFCADSENSASAVKRKSRELVLPEDWSKRKVEVMRECLEQKFQKEPFKTKLIETGISRLEEGNTWGDTFWGTDLKSGRGENMLGELIMKIRKKLIDSRQHKLF